jgi:hypothetical protein
LKWIDIFRSSETKQKRLDAWKKLCAVLCDRRLDIYSAPHQLITIFCIYHLSIPFRNFFL